MTDVQKAAEFFKDCHLEKFYTAPDLDAGEFAKAKECCDADDIAIGETIAFQGVRTMTRASSMLTSFRWTLEKSDSIQNLVLRPLHSGIPWCLVRSWLGRSQ